MSLEDLKNIPHGKTAIELKNIFLAFGAKGMFVLSEIWISSTDTIGGKSIGSLSIKGRLKTVSIIMTEWKVIE